MTKSALIIRFNAIGDIVLTSPVIDALFDNGYEVHYLVKSSFKDVLVHDKKVKTIWSLDDSLEEVIGQLKNVSFSVIIDLHNNLRSRKVKSALKTKTLTLVKKRWQLWKLTQTPFKSYQETHIVRRFLDVITPLGIVVDNPQTRYALDGVSLPSDLLIPREPYLVIAVGAAWETKRIPKETLLHLCENTAASHVMLIGSQQDQSLAQYLKTNAKRDTIDLTGSLTISQSALVISQAKVLVSGDTGPLHIAAALRIPVVAIYGSTHPALGYTPYYGTVGVPHHVIQNENLSCRPCTKQGKKKCPKGHFKCMVELDKTEIVDKVNSYFE